MKYKLVAVDVDGTLLDSNSNLTPETIKAIQETIAAGVIVTICTGRPIQGVEPLIEQLGLDLPFITYNGAMIVMGKSRKILYAQTMRGEDVKTVYKLGTNLKTTVVIWADNKLYVQPFGPEATAYSDLSRTKPEPITDLEALIAQGVTKVLFYDTVEAIRHFEKQVAPAVPPTVNYCTSQPFLLEFFDQKVSKANALAQLSAYYGFSREEIIAIGDGFNDLSMIKYAGLGIAMANADAAIKQHADYVTLSNDENGVAHALYRFCLNKAL
ncbi:Cof-type HAD-IIB family hydrolase [Capillibacterium thermochitinicola]|uniref:HAD family phosphatase n=1 Tax=Capillibacterium thermochitinicola TaxID=2699427 RepID=A0A8J6I2I8_9FIRM|nr:Cof-type HAD-IIB family hydrolase [Capillibacterium thermochitinicola]MBA2133274.1 HAD family phosphatase [Capillibacterium thermochitinicola]